MRAFEALEVLLCELWIHLRRQSSWAMRVHLQGCVQPRGFVASSMANYGGQLCVDEYDQMVGSYENQQSPPLCICSRVLPGFMRLITC